MALLDFLNTSLVVNIATILLLLVLVGGLYAYFSNKLSAQDHKISSMVSCVSTMAEEIQLFRKQINEKCNNDGQLNTVHLPSHVLTGGSRNNLIEVSDNDSDDEDDDDTSDEDASQDSEHESGSEGESESESESETGSETSEMVDDHLEPFKLDEKCDLDDLSLGDDIVECENIKTVHIDNDDEHERKTDLHLDETVDLTKFPIPYLKEEEMDTEKAPQEYLVNSEQLKTISIVDNDNDSDDEHPDSQDYKKMSLTKLRELAVKNNLTNDASKMKKNDILKLMGFK